MQPDGFTVVTYVTALIVAYLGFQKGQDRGSSAGEDGGAEGCGEGGNPSPPGGKIFVLELKIVSFGAICGASTTSFIIYKHSMWDKVPYVTSALVFLF